MKNHTLSESLLLGGGLALAAVGLVLVLQPAQFRASARVRPEYVLFSMTETGMVYDPYFFQHQFEFVQSATVLNDAVRRLRPQAPESERWPFQAGGDTVHDLRLLRASLGHRPVRGTAFFEIFATASDPKLAAAMANAVAESYRDQSERLLRTNQVRLKDLWRQKLKEHPGLEAAQERMALLVRELRVSAAEYHWVSLASEARYRPARAKELAPLVEAEQDFGRQLKAAGTPDDYFFSEFNNLLVRAMIALPSLADPVIPAVEVIDVATPPAEPIPSNQLLGAVLLAIGLTGVAVGVLRRKRRGRVLAARAG